MPQISIRGMLSTNLILLFFSTALLAEVHALDGRKKSVSTPTTSTPASIVTVNVKPTLEPEARRLYAKENHDDVESSNSPNIPSENTPALEDNLALSDSMNLQLVCISSCTSATPLKPLQVVSTPILKIRASKVTSISSLPPGPDSGASLSHAPHSLDSTEILATRPVTVTLNQESILLEEPNNVLASLTQPSTQQHPEATTPPVSIHTFKRAPNFVTVSLSLQLALPIPPLFTDDPSLSKLLGEPPDVPKMTHVPIPLPRSSPGVLPITPLAPLSYSPKIPSIPDVSVGPGASAIIIPLPHSATVQVPQQSFAFTTITEMYDGSTTAISVVATPSLLGQTGTVVVRVPQTTAADFEFTTITSVYSGAIVATSTAAIPNLSGQVGTALVQVPHQFAALTLLSTPGASGIETLPSGKSFVAGTASGIGRPGASSSPPSFIGGTDRGAATGGSTILLGVAGKVLGWL